GKLTDAEDGKTKGWLYELTTEALPPGFFQYKFHLTYTSGATRIVCDPCTRYGGVSDQNSGFVIGGPKMDTVPLANPRTLDQLVLYELMIDDFTAIIAGNKAPLAVVRGQLGDLGPLGVTGIPFTPSHPCPTHTYTPRTYHPLP